MRFRFHDRALKKAARLAQRIKALMLLPGNTPPAATDPTQPSSFFPNATAAFLALVSSIGAAIFCGPGNWGVNSAPAAATQATISKAAVAGVRHVCRGISAALSTGATAQAAAAVLVLRDGASGVGAILWQKQVILPINGLFSVDLTDLNLVGSVNTAMTLEFTAAGVAGSFQSVSLSGYDAQ